jgi:hypothetical protein
MMIVEVEIDSVGVVIFVVADEFVSVVDPMFDAVDVEMSVVTPIVVETSLANANDDDDDDVVVVVDGDEVADDTVAIVACVPTALVSVVVVMVLVDD